MYQNNSLLRLPIRLIFLFFMLLLNVPSVSAEEVNIAVVTDFYNPLTKIAGAFEQCTGYKANITTGSEQQLDDLIHKGESFDILLSADKQVLQQLEMSGIGVLNTRFIYALAQLVLWSAQPNLIDSKGEVLRQGQFNQLALPNPQYCVCGMVAQQVMHNLGVWEQLQPKLKYYESVSHVYQAIANGEVELGFITLSMLNPSKRISGSFWIVPAILYSPLEQQAILLKRGENNRAAQAFLKYLKSPRARNAIESYGYIMPLY